MKIVNKAKRIDEFTTKQLDYIIVERIDNSYHIKCTFDEGKGQFEIVLHKDIFKKLFMKEVKKQLLKEIEKEKKKYAGRNRGWTAEIIEGLEIAEEKIKKAFEELE